MRWRGRRSRRGWERDLLREIQALETTDEGHDGVVTPITGRVRRPRRARRVRAVRTPASPYEVRRRGAERTRTLWTVAVTIVIIVALGAASLGPAAPFVRRLIGMGPSGGGDGHAYAFIRRDPRGRPAGFSPCSDIHYVVNTSEAPSDWSSIVSDSIGAVSAATGLTFVDDGTTTDDNYFDRRRFLTDSPEDVLIGWTTADRIHDLDGDVAGVTSSDYNPQTGHYDTGTVVLDADAFREIATEPGGSRTERAIVMHELGHLVGLAHVDDPHQLMYPTTTTQTQYGNGDLAGLKVLGEVHC